jgi:predicted dehydrogenase
MLSPYRPSRRQFVRGLAAGAAALPLLNTDLGAAPEKGPNDRITLGFIGVGTMGRGHLGSFLGAPGVQVVTVCDVVAQRREAARKTVNDHYAGKAKGEHKGCDAYNDFRDLLTRKDVDAVVIATPDHWHAIACILAARAGKDIYCEKPLTHSIAEGRRIVEEVAKAKVIFQTGSQQRSEFGGHFRKAVELVRNGRIGKLKTVRIGVGGPAVPCDLPTQEIPEGTDWDFWLGPAPKRGYNEVLCPKGVHNHFPAWRNYLEYAGGGLADMGAHHFDIAQWALDMDASGPVKVEPPAGKETKGLKFTYANGVEMFHGGEADCVFVGTDGTVLASREYLRTKPEGILKEPIGEKDFHVYPSSDHRRNWLECVRSRKACICPAEVGHRSATICHLGNIGYRLRRTLTWDPVQERFVDDDEANRLLYREPRPAWKV